MDQLVTREGELFQVSDRRGDFVPEERACGLFFHDTRYLSRFELLVAGYKPELLGADSARNYVQAVFGQARGQTESLFRAFNLGVQRHRVIWGGVMYERITVTNHETAPMPARVELRYGADFADLFEVRGYQRARRGDALPFEVSEAGVTLGYRGLDAIVRQTRISFGTAPAVVAGDRAVWEAELPPQGALIIDVAVAPAENGDFPAAVGFDAALSAAAQAYITWQASLPVVASDNEMFNRVLRRAVLDLRTLAADIGHGPFPVAGIPWFAVPFGRDSILTAIEALPFAPELARGTLRTLGALQGTEINAWRQEEPGKIPHELRFGEMANTDEIPFKRYYGTVDSTPLYLVLLCDYYAWTGDLELVRELLPNVRAALHWIDTYGDQNGEGFLEYRADAGVGLAVQSWKDSTNSMTHRDLRPAQSPVSVSEVQGYAYDAKRRLAPMMAQLGEPALAAKLAQEAAALKARFHQAYWMDDRAYYAIALAGERCEQVGTSASDIGHCLWSGIVPEEHAAAVAQRLLSPELFSGWGIRTLSTHERSYNPLSYHNGSVWPHDTAFCALGLKRYGFEQAANVVIGGLLEAAMHFEYFRLPELFCGYSREEGAPVGYPAACSPQAWAAAVPFAMLQVILGLQPDAAAGVLRLRPCLPPFLGRLGVIGLRVGGAIVDIEVTREGVTTALRQGRLELIVDAANQQHFGAAQQVERAGSATLRLRS
ncbi:MAG TPA: amylo-alpha-1,6-glucosidase [Symbiobacteriaceae bacterium]|nr:amylo-alpha-1,6-glucosidase [Symbiobacteriaceae bacterium]